MEDLMCLTPSNSHGPAVHKSKLTFGLMSMHIWEWSLLQTQHTASSAKPSLDASDPPGQLHVLGEKSDSASM